MGTQGIFVIRKGSIDKELTIGHDAYPDVAGMEIVELLKTVNMDRLFSLIDDYHEAASDVESFDDPNFTDEPERFNYLRIKAAIWGGSTIYGTVYDKPVTEGTIFSEHAYVADLDNHMILFYVDGVPKDVNFRNIELGRLTKYPYILKASFELEYVRRVRARLTVDAMNAAVTSDDVLKYTTADIRSEDEVRENYPLQKQMSIELIQTIKARLTTLQKRHLAQILSMRAGRTKSYTNIRIFSLRSKRQKRILTCSDRYNGRTECCYGREILFWLLGS